MKIALLLLYVTQCVTTTTTFLVIIFPLSSSFDTIDNNRITTIHTRTTTKISEYQQPTPLPITPVDLAYFKLVNDGPCTVTSNCIYSTNYPNKYDVDDICNFTVLQETILNVKHFELETNYDYLYVNDVSYTSTNGPNNVQVYSGDILLFNSDSSIQKTGFEICRLKSNNRSNKNNNKFSDVLTLLMIIGITLCFCVFFYYVTNHSLCSSSNSSSIHDLQTVHPLSEQQQEDSGLALQQLSNTLNYDADDEMTSSTDTSPGESIASVVT